MRAPNLLIALVLLILPTLGCGDTQPRVGWTTSVDTLNDGVGPIIVVNAPDVEGSDPPPTWRFEELFRVGGGVEEGPSSFGQIAQIAVDSGGRLATLDYQAQELRVFGPGGDYLHTFGGKGSGPGELDLAFGVTADGGDLLVPEFRNARLSVFGADKGFITSHPARFFSYGMSGWRAVVDSGGRLLVPSSGEGLRFVIRTYDRSMTPLDTIPYRAYEDVPATVSWRVPMGRGQSMVYNPVAHYVEELLDRSGMMWFASYDGSYRLTRYVPGGDTLRIVEVRRPRRAVAASERDSIIEDLRTKLSGAGMPTELDWSLIPELHPAVHEVNQSEEGDLWLRTSPWNVDPTLYDVLDREGRYRGTAAIPGRVKPRIAPIVRGDLVWAVVLGELDVESVLHGRLVPLDPSDKN
jgi:hypothetical protein